MNGGLETCRLLAPKIERTVCWRIERNAPGRKQRLERPGVEIADDQPFDQDADNRGDDESERYGEGERPALQARRQEELDDIGRVGAEHHHLAVRHVDDAHDAEGDREADRREQQDGRGGEAVPEILRRAPEQEPGMDGGKRRVRRRLDLRVRGLLVERVDQVLRILIAAAFQRLDRREPVRRGRVIAGRDDRRDGELSARRRRADRFPWRVGP